MSHDPARSAASVPTAPAHSTPGPGPGLVGSLPIVALAALALPVTAAVAAAQPAVDPATVDLPAVADLVEPEPRFRLDFGYEYQGESSLSGGGRLGVQRADLDLGYRMPLEGVGGLALNLDYDLGIYDFERTQSFGEPWDDVHQLAFSARIDVDIDNEWVLFGGPIVRYAGESGADLTDSLTGGGFAGVAWSPDEYLTVGFGIALVDEIEDDLRTIPMIILDWQITDGFSLRTTPTSFITGATEFQAAWQVDRDVELSLGYLLGSERRFRLDDDGTVLDGVGGEEGQWIYFRGSWALSDNTDFTASVGLALEPDVLLGTSSGVEITEVSYDEIFSIGGRFSIRF